VQLISHLYEQYRGAILLIIELAPSMEDEDDFTLDEDDFAAHKCATDLDGMMINFDAKSEL